MWHQEASRQARLSLKSQQPKSEEKPANLVAKKDQHMFQGLQNGWDLIKESIKVFNHHPTFILPLLLTWLVYAPIILYMEYLFDWQLYTVAQRYLIVAGVIFVFGFLLSFSCSVLLELIQQLESGKAISLVKAFRYTLGSNMIRIVPIVFVWTVIWFIVLLLQALVPKDRKRKVDGASFSAENAARTLVSFGSFSFPRAILEALQKGVRMVVFLILPAIAWENLSFLQAVKKGLAIFKANLSAFVTGFVLTGLAAAVILLPPGVLFYISDKLDHWGADVTFPDWVWIITTVYIAVGWSYSIYLEQMFCAELYLWNHKWEKEVTKAQREGRPIPILYQVARPSLLDDVHELVEKAVDYMPPPSSDKLH